MEVLLAPKCTMKTGEIGTLLNVTVGDCITMVGQHGVILRQFSLSYNGIAARDQCSSGVGVATCVM